jgi:hypothetical protein
MFLLLRLSYFIKYLLSDNGLTGAEFHTVCYQYSIQVCCLYQFIVLIKDIINQLNLHVDTAFFSYYFHIFLFIFGPEKDLLFFHIVTTVNY